MQSIDFTLVVGNECEHILSIMRVIDESEVHHVTLTTVSWIPDNTYVFINDAMRQRLDLGLRKALPLDNFSSSMSDIAFPDRSYSTCQPIFFSPDAYNDVTLSFATPILIPDLPVDIVIGTQLFSKFGLVWNLRLNRWLTRREQQEERAREANRNAYRNLL
ncbi:unnamed protein product [Adineta ricciae]|uniref:Uncharacterized protein n=1 Tax=Adineta ricciae TaxID=249248 RepID=A0A815U562_ADIRI|nr:unnamed protein product [Adineta ricciae]